MSEMVNIRQLFQHHSRRSTVGIFWLLLCDIILVTASQVAGQNGETNLKGHMQPFGESGPPLEIQTRNQFPEPLDFLTNFVKASKPLKLSGVAKDSRAVRHWTDEYLLSLEVPHDSVVQLETKKKENRSQETDAMHFHEFLKIYNQTEHYMVDDVPPYLRPDVNVPCSLQCPELLEEGFAFAIMWFSSGGTKSVIHTDAFDNINCLIRGEKAFVMVDPAVHREKIELRQQGAYSDIDVDSVDLTVYPALAEVEFYHVNVSAGDCLFIPYRWIHQVRSFNSNVAVNFWWDHHSTVNLLKKEPEGSTCQGHCDPTLTLDKVELRGQETSLEDIGNVKDWLQDVVISNPMTVDSVRELVKMEFMSEELPPAAENIALKLFKRLDYDMDGQYTLEDHKQIVDETWDDILEDITALTFMLEENVKAERKEYAEYVEADRRDEL